MSLICTRISSACHSYVLVYHPYVFCMYSYVIRMSLVCSFTMNRFIATPNLNFFAVWWSVNFFCSKFPDIPVKQKNNNEIGNYKVLCFSSKRKKKMYKIPISPIMSHSNITWKQFLSTFEFYLSDYETKLWLFPARNCFALRKKHCFSLEINKKLLFHFSIHFIKSITFLFYFTYVWWK